MTTTVYTACVRIFETREAAAAAIQDAGEPDAVIGEIVIPDGATETRRGSLLRAIELGASQATVDKLAAAGLLFRGPTVKLPKGKLGGTRP